ncbi:tetratricopeptide repeat protein 24 isoform X2 [Neopelma chrysocephalum]|uniref:tetratricopeptide repeat protein 24 isoform X2 n=1 Tax=Neopelma chrysocephalum TaxID=114329 RepID=UPI000FCCE97B|nr:tetratricopeptide repeat protein 24 isoform X2 [Neopelma chrysocephalum]
MASEEAADPGVQPTSPDNPVLPTTSTTTPAAPAASAAPTNPPSCKKSQKKKEKAKARGGAQEGGDEAVGRVAAIEGLTQAGRQALALGAGQEAVGCFRKALLLSRDMVSTQLHRACAFNLGAAYVETGKPRKALEFLLQSQPSEREKGEHSGDLYFNAGAAQEGLQDFPKACFGKATGHNDMSQAGGQAGTHVQMGCCYLGLREPARAARCFLAAAQTYRAAESPEGAAVALSRASGSMLQSQRFRAAEIAGVLAQCRSLCETIPDPALRGKLYNDIGLGYSQLHIFSLAAESFERALGLCGGELERDRHQEAALLQNLGAAHNALDSFGTALGWHRRAAALHGALGNRRAQGQCFGNLAYACSRLGNHEAAAENYLHALQAFRDAGDVQGQWQACEGLGTACFHLGDPQKAIEHYQEALTLLSHCQDTPRAAREQVVHKLTDAIQHRLCLGGRLSRSGGRVPTPAPELSQLRFCSMLPQASGTRVQGSEVSFGGKAKDQLYMCVPGAHPRHSGRGVALTDGLSLEPRNPHSILSTSGEDEGGPSVAPGCLSQSQANSNRTTPLCLAPPPHTDLQPWHCDHQTLQPRPLERPGDDPTATVTSCWPRREPRRGTRTLSLVCNLV